MLARSDLRKYQRWGVDLIKSMWKPAQPEDPDYPLAHGKPGVGLFFDLGSGKTATVLTAIRDLRDSLTINRVLVVAPLLVARVTWPDEIENWKHTRPLSWTLLRVEDGDPDLKVARKSALDEARAQWLKGKDATKFVDQKELAAKYAKLARLAAQKTEIHIINREAVPWLWEHFKGKWPYDLVVVDENIFKAGKQRVVKEMVDGKAIFGGLTRAGAMYRARKFASKVIVLTGTPAPKGIENLWGLLYFIDLGARLGTSRTEFERRWFSYDAYTRKRTPFADAEAEILGKTKDVLFSLDPKDLATLPPMVPNPIKVKLPDRVLERYHLFKKELVSEEYDVEAANAGVLHNKLLQFANGSMYQESGEDVFIHDEKLKALEQIVEETGGASLLVAYSFKFDVERIRSKFKNAVVLNECDDPRDVVARWSDGKIDMLLAHRASAGHGLNLQYGGHHMVEYGFTSDLELYLQFLKRIARPGQKHTMFNHMIIAEGTIDEDIYPVYLDPKNATQERILTATRIAMMNTS